MRVTLVLTLAASVLAAACGEADDDDIGDVDAALDPANIQISWRALAGEEDVGCEGVGATQVTVSAVPSDGGSGETDSFPCSDYTGTTSVGFEPGTYDVTIRLKSPAGPVGEGYVARDIVLAPGETKNVGTVSLSASPNGSASFKVDVGIATGSNCGTTPNADGHVTEMRVEIRNADQECVPVTLNVDGVPRAIGCDPVPTGPCIENDDNIVTPSLPVGQYFLDVVAYRPDPANGNALVDCYGTNQEFTVYGGDLENDLPTFQLLTMAVPPPLCVDLDP